MRHIFALSTSLRIRRAALALALTLPAVATHAQGAPETLSNASITEMITGKLSRELITAKINSSRPGFDLSSEGIVGLYASKVDPTIIKVMLEAGQAAKKRGDAPRELTGLDETMTNESVVRMVAAKVQKSIILTKIYAGRPSFDVSTGGLVKLSENKVPQDIIKVMMSPTPPTPKKF